jgi:hypothetical protein
MTGKDMPDAVAVLVETVVHRHDGAPGIAEQGVHSFGEQTLNKGVASGDTGFG